MNKKLIPMVVLILVLIVPLFQYATAPKPQEIPFVGMSLVYYANHDGETIIRVVCVLKYDSATNCVTIVDSPGNNEMEVNVATREIEWTPGPPFVGYVEYWIPTDIYIGSHVNILEADAVVIGSTKLSISGKTVNVWQLQWIYTDGPYGGIGGETTWYYEKNTGLWVGAAWVEYDDNGHVVANWGGHLVSTNVVLQ